MPAAGRPAAGIAVLILDLLARRGPGKTLCPSEVARALDSDGWRGRMAEIHAAAAALARDGQVRLTRRGRPLDPEAPCGIYRIGMAAGQSQSD